VINNNKELNKTLEEEKARRYSPAFSFLIKSFSDFSIAHLKNLIEYKTAMIRTTIIFVSRNEEICTILSCVSPGIKHILERYSKACGNESALKNTHPVITISKV
jgi:hypothetical protein